jgi:hypothetical protein
MKTEIIPIYNNHSVNNVIRFMPIDNLPDRVKKTIAEGVYFATFYRNDNIVSTDDYGNTFEH